MKILICDLEYNESDFLEDKKILTEQIPDARVESYIYTGDKQAFIKAVSDADYIITSYAPITADVMASAKVLKMISVTGTGYGTIDVKAAAELGISVCNVTDYCTEEVAIHTVSMVMALMRGLKAHDRHIETTREWNFQYVPDVSVPSKMNVVIYGYGNIGKKSASLFKALGMNVYIVSNHADYEELEKNGMRKIDESLTGSIADVICNHQSATALRKHYFDKDWFNSLTRKPLFINCGRGISVDEDALVDALEAHLISGTGLDVLESESPDLIHSRLVGREDVILTPHSAFYSADSAYRLQKDACMNIVNHAVTGNYYDKNCVVKGMR